MAKGLFDCTGKVTMVTGGNSGLGLGFAMGCAKMGWDIAIWARSEEKNAIAKEKLLAAGAPRVETYRVDVTSEEQVTEGCKQLKADFGRLDCVFASSGRGDPEQMAQIDAHFSAKTLIHRPGYPEDFEGIAAYLCSDASRFHTGDTLVIDGGSVIHAPYAFN